MEMKQHDLIAKQFDVLLGDYGRTACAKGSVLRQCQETLNAVLLPTDKVYGENLSELQQHLA